MRQFRVRIFINEGRFQDTVIYADNPYNAEDIGRGQSPIGRASFLGEVVSSDW